MKFVNQSFQYIGTLTTSSNSTTDSANVQVTFVDQGSGTLKVSALYTPNPKFDQIYAYTIEGDNDVIICNISTSIFSNKNAMCSKDLTPGAISYWYTYMNWGTKPHKDSTISGSVASDCGSITSSYSSNVVWNHPKTDGQVCKLTFTATNYVDIINGNNEVVDKKPLVGKFSIGAHFANP